MYLRNLNPGDMKLQINFKEVTYGWWEIEVPDDATDEEIMEKAWDEYGNSDINYGKCDMDITDWEEI